MRIMGAAQQWATVIDSRVPDIIKLIVAVWKRVEAGEPDEREDAITARLCVALQRSRTARKLMFYIQFQPVELDPATGAEFGRMDIAFFPSGERLVPREDIYFCLECKRLNVVKDGKTRSYAMEYVTMGVVRFVTGQYARAVRHGCMIGYVRDGNLEGAMGNVEKNLKKRHAELGMEPPGCFKASGLLPRTANARETHHKRAQNGNSFRLHHLFMAGIARAAV